MIGHRVEREDQVLACVTEGLDTIEAIVRKLYADVDVRLHRAAGRSVLAHLLKLVGEGRVRREAASGGDASNAHFVAV